MLGIVLIELLKGIGRMFVNPLFYWIILLLFMIGWRRIKKERHYFGRKIYPLFTELKGTLWITIVFSLILSVASILLGFMMSVEMIVLLILVTVIVSVTGRTTLLSASYTFGITFILLLLLPYINLGLLGTYVDVDSITIVHFLSLVFFMVILLFAESMLISTKKGASFPELQLSPRGLWGGQHHLKRLAVIPFITLLPVQDPTLALPIFPYFEYADRGYSLMLIPFVIGANYTVRSMLPEHAVKKLGQANCLLAVAVLLIASVSFFYPYVAIIAVIGAIIGKELVAYLYKRKENQKQSLYQPLDKGIKVLAVSPESRAEHLGISIGETILKVNGLPVINQEQFYESLQNSGAFVKLDILDIHQEIYFINSPLYEQDHHTLGLLFADKPYYIK